jgi:hypothetical protein
MAFTDIERQNRFRDTHNAAALATALEPLLEALFLEGHTHVAAASPGTVAALMCQLERLLVAHGIVPQSKRAQDPQAYARNLQRVEDRAFREEFEIRCGERRRTRQLSNAGIPDAETSSIVESVSAAVPAAAKDGAD